MAPKRWYLAIVQFGGPTNELFIRAKQDFPTMANALKKLSDDCCMLLGASREGQTMIWALRTSANSKTITARLCNPVRNDPNTSRQEIVVPDAFRKGDKIIVIQLGEDRCLTDMNVIRQWFDTNWASGSR